jgi:hypothetical protein
MGTFIYIDSNFREDTNEPATFFHIYTNQTVNWPLNPRTVKVVAPSIYNQSPDFLSTIEIHDLFIFYDAVIAEPFVKISFYNTEYNDFNLITTLDDQTDLKFIARSQKDYQNGWVRYTSDMEQVMRFKRKGTFLFKIIDKDNNILNAGVGGRVTAVFSVTPFVLDYHDNQVRNIP